MADTQWQPQLTITPNKTNDKRQIATSTWQLSHGKQDITHNNIPNDKLHITLTNNKWQIGQLTNDKFQTPNNNHNSKYH